MNDPSRDASERLPAGRPIREGLEANLALAVVESGAVGAPLVVRFLARRGRVLAALLRSLVVAPERFDGL